MKAKPADLTGLKFGMLTAYRYSDVQKNHWHCICDCGQLASVRSQNLRIGKAKSCGCHRSKIMASGMNITHGYSDKTDPTYKSWCSMRERCNQPGNSAYARYGAVGIKVCARWDQFENFLHDMGERPKGKTLDRYPDKNGGYSPDNCRWATHREQQNNLVNNRVILYKEAYMTIRQLSDLTGTKYQLLRDRILKAKWDGCDGFGMVGNVVYQDRCPFCDGMGEKPTVAQLKADFDTKRLAAERAAYAWFCECDVGPERERASDIYENIRCATRRG